MVDWGEHKEGGGGRGEKVGENRDILRAAARWSRSTMEGNKWLHGEGADCRRGLLPICPLILCKLWTNQ